MRNKARLIENLIIRDGVEPNGLDVLEYAGFSGDGGLLYQAAAEAALLAGDDWGRVTITVPTYNAPMGGMRRLEVFMMFRSLHKQLMDSMKSALDKVEAKEKPQREDAFRQVLRQSIATARLYERDVLEGGGMSNELANSFGELEYERFDLEGLVGNKAERDTALRHAKARKFTGRVASALNGSRSRSFGIDQNTFDLEDAFSAMVVEQAEQAAQAVFKALEIKVPVEVVEGGGAHVRVEGPLGGVDLRHVRAFEDIEFLFRLPSTSPVRLKRVQMYKSPIKQEKGPSEFDDAVRDAVRGHRRALVAAERKAQKRAGIKDTAVAISPGIMYLQDAMRKSRSRAQRLQR